MNKKTVAIIVAGGTGNRMGEDIPKQFIKLYDKEIILYTLETFDKCDFVNEIVVVCHRDYIDICKNISLSIKKDVLIVEGGNSRQQSVINGLNAIKDCEYVLVHDAVRCLVRISDIKNLYNELLASGSCTLAVKSKDTVMISDDNNMVVSTPSRNYIWQIQTPQAFRFDELFSAHVYAHDTSFEATDDCSVIEHYGKTVKLVEGSYTNIKITTPSDLEIAKVFMKGSELKSE